MKKAFTILLTGLLLFSMRSQAQSQQNIVAPTPVIQFDGPEQGSSGVTPAGIAGASGPNHILTIRNTAGTNAAAIYIYSKTGQLLSTKSFNDYFNASYSNFKDPRVVYDHIEQRWIIVALAENIGAKLLCVMHSKSDDPLGDWDRFTPILPFYSSFVQPKIGFSKNWISVTGYYVETGFPSGSSMTYAWHRENFYSGIPATYWVSQAHGSGDLYPVMTYDTSMADLYLVSVNSAGSGGRLRLAKLYGDPEKAPLFDNDGVLINLNNPWSNSGPDAPQLGSGTGIAMPSFRISSAAYRNGTIWFAHTIFLPATNPNRAAVQWGQVSPATASILQLGRIDNGNASTFYAFPSIAVDADNNMLIGFNQFSTSAYPSAAYAYHRASDPAGAISTPFVYKNGTAAYTLPWGDYSATALDPKENAMWSLQQYVKAGNKWGTQWVKIDGSTGSGYCQSAGGSASEWIDKVEISNVSNASGNNGGYKQFGNPVVQLAKGFSYTVNLTPGFSGANLPEQWRIWIDLNNDQDFDDPGELLFSSTAPSANVVTANITIPASAPGGSARMRVSMREGALPANCGSFSGGEVEDYTVSIQNQQSTIQVEPAVVQCNPGGDTVLVQVTANDSWTTIPTILPSLDWVKFSSMPANLPTPPPPVTVTVVCAENYTAQGNSITVLFQTSGGGSAPLTVKQTPKAPIAYFTLSATGGIAPLSVHFTDISSNFPQSWHWDFGDGGSSNQQNPDYVFQTTGVFTVVLTVSNAGGSSSYETIVSVSLDDVTPVAGFTADQTCGAAPFIVHFTDQSANDPSDWIWDFGDGNVSTDRNPVYTFSTPGLYAVSLIVTSVGGSDIEYKNAYIRVLEPVQLQATPGVPICSGNPVTLSATGVADHYSWSGPGLSAGNGKTVTVTPPNTGYNTFTLTATTANCPPIQQQITVQVQAAPVIGITLSQSEICLGQSVTLTATGNADQFEWTGSGLSASNGNTVFATPATTGVSMFSVRGLIGSCASDEQFINLFVNPTPTVNINASGNDVCVGAALNLSATGNADFYHWSGPDLSSAQGNNVIATPLSPGQAIYTVRGVTGACQSDEQTIQISVHPAPVISAQASVSDICLGGTVTLSAAGNADDYNWSGPGLSTNSGSTVEAIPVTSGLADYTVYGVKDGCQSDIQTIQIAVNQLSVISAQASATEICLGTAFSLSASGDADSFHWSGSGLSAVQGNTVEATPLNSGLAIYTVYGVKGTCHSDVQTIQVLVNPAPLFTVQATSTVICLGSSVDVSVSGNANSYNWSGPGLSATTGNHVTVTPSNAGLASYSVQGFTGNCASPQQTIYISVVTSPQVFVTTLGQPVCAGDLITLSAGGNADQFMWTGPGLSSNTGASVTVQSNAAGLWTYSVRGMLGTCQGPEQDFTIEVHALPTISTDVSVDSICLGASVSLQANGAASYNWSGPGLNAGAGSSVIGTPDATGNMLYTVVGTDAFGCKNSHSQAVFVQNTPNLVISADPQTICLGENIQLSAGGADHYNWSGTALADSIGSIVTASPSSPGTFYYTVQGDNGLCSAIQTTAVTVTPPNEISVLVTMGGCPGPNLEYNALVSGAGPNPNILWYVDGAPVWTGPLYTLYNAVAGSQVWCTVTAMNPPACTAQTTVESAVSTVTCIATGTHASDLEQDLKLYPNPNNGTFQLQWESTQAGPCNLFIYNMLGELIWQDACVAQAGANAYTIQPAGLSPGMYRLRLELGGKSVMRLFEVEAW